METIGFYNLRLIVLGTLSLAGCIEPKQDSGANSSDDIRSTNSCISSSENSFSLVNGEIDAKDEYSPVLEIKSGLSVCTGTFVSDNTLITAAHCIKSGEPGGGIKALFKGKSLAPTKTFVPVVPIEEKREPKNDVAVVVFANGTADEWFPVSRVPPRVGQRITIVGFGQTDFVGNNASDEKRRFGYNTITEITDGGATIVYELKVTCQGQALGKDAMAGRGDSGGPLFTKSGLIGIISRGEIVSGKLIEYDANLVTPAMSKFLQMTMKEGAKINGLSPEEKELAVPQ
jgi:hypothetical protein